MHERYQIETEDEYREALKRFLRICSTVRSDEELEELLLLMNLMEKYERQNCGNN